MTTGSTFHDCSVATTIFLGKSCTPEGKIEFVDWFSHIDMPDEEDWLVVGDFNLIIKPEDRNKPGSDINEMFMFNTAINSLGLIEIPLHGRKYTWCNKQEDSLLEIGQLATRILFLWG